MSARVPDHAAMSADECRRLLSENPARRVSTYERLVEERGKPRIAFACGRCDECEGGDSQFCLSPVVRW